MTASMSLLLSSVVGIGPTAASDECSGSSTAASAPPGQAYADFPAIVVRVDWGEQRRNSMLTYVVTRSSEPLISPYGGGGATGWSAGCDAAAVGGCETVEPLILTDAPVTGANVTWLAEGRYTIVAGNAAACAYYQGDKPIYAKASDPMPVSASIEYYPAAGKGPPLSWMVESVDVPTYELAPMDASARRSLGTFDWDPVRGISNLTAAGASDATVTASDPGVPDAPPLPPGIIAGSPPGPGDFSTPDEEPDLPEDQAATTDPDAPTGAVPDTAERLMRFLVAMGVSIDPFRNASEGTDAERALDGVMLLRALVVLALRSALDQGRDTADLAAAYHALGLIGLLLEDEEAATPPTRKDTTGATAEAPKGGGKLPKMKGAAKKQGREWVWLPAPAIVYQTYPTVEEKKLKTGTWYQMRENDDGSRDFYNRKGKWIGTNPPKERDQVVVRKKGEGVGE
jgi:hypothetical protein